MTKLTDLADRLERAEGKGRMRFSLLGGIGWVSTHGEEAIRALCDVWNNRWEVARALREYEGGDVAKANETGLSGRNGDSK